jgi:endo-1,4-beta-xylanase
MVVSSPGSTIIELLVVMAIMCPGVLPVADVKRSGTGGLKSVYGKLFDIGAAIPGADLKDAEIALLSKHFSTVTPENCMKPEPIHPEEGRYDFTAGDALVKMAKSKGLTVNGHTLVWHYQCPDWFFVDNGKPAGRELVLKRMREHIAAVAGHYSGKLASWDVVNEAIDDGKGYLRNTKWTQCIGDDFIAEAFMAARKADPKAELYYNDYSIEGGGKREKTLRLIRELKQRNVPISGVGIQGHWQVGRVPLKDIEAAIVAFHAEGMKVAITELDIDVVSRSASGANVNAREKGADDPFVDGLTPEMQKKLADDYTRLFELFLKHRDKISRVTFWGLHDGRSWLNSWPRKRTNHALLFDRALKPKPAAESVLELGRKQ